MSSMEAFIFLLAVVSMSHTVTPSELTDLTEQYVVSEPEAEHLVYEWTIKNFTLLPGGEQCYNSSDFRAKKNDVGWKMGFCPKVLDNKGYFASVDLYPNSPQGSMKSFKIGGEFSILKSGHIIANRTFEGKLMEQEKCTTAKRYDYNHDYDAELIEYTVCNENHYNVRLEDLLSSSDSNDNITIRWEIVMPIKVVNKMINVKEQKNIHNPQKGHLNEDYGRLLKEKKFSDVDIIVGDQKLAAHKIILAARSPEFAELLENAEINDIGKSRVTIDNVEPAVMTAVLEYLYTDDVANLDEFPSIFGLLSAAHDFKLPHLKTMCEEVLHKKLDADTAADILVFTDRYGLVKLKKHAMEFIRNHFPDVMETEGYKKMKDKSPALLMEILFSATDKRF